MKKSESKNILSTLLFSGKSGFEVIKPGIFFILLLCLLAFHASASNQIPGAPQKEPIALTGGTVHTVSGAVIANGTVVFENGRITAVGRNVSIPPDAVRIDCTGKHIYPGLIEINSNIGLYEISSVRGTVDIRELGNINPSLRAETAVNPESEHIPSTRSGGIAIAATLPGGGIISGMAAVIMLDGWTWEHMTLNAPSGLVIHWPGTEENHHLLETAFSEARAYLSSKNASAVSKSDMRWEAMIEVLEGRVPVWMHVNGARNIEAAVEWADREQVKMVIFGGQQADRVTALLRNKDIPVVVTPVLRLPLRPDDSYDAPFTLANKLHSAGVRFCIGSGDQRNLSYHAALAAAYGLPKEQALKAVTQHAAGILGLSERVGSIETGKDATLIITDGDPLEIATQIEGMFIQGRQVDLGDKHKTLYHKYQERYKQGW